MQTDLATDVYPLQRYGNNGASGDWVIPVLSSKGMMEWNLWGSAARLLAYPGWICIAFFPLIG
jgi:hypothetical protein